MKGLCFLYYLWCVIMALRVRRYYDVLDVEQLGKMKIAMYFLIGYGFWNV